MREIRIEIEDDGTITVIIDGNRTNLKWTSYTPDTEDYQEVMEARLAHLGMFRWALNGDSALNDEERDYILTLVSDELTKNKTGKIQ